MANIKQQIKRNKTNEKARLRNASFKSATRSAVKAVETAVAENNLEKAELALPKAHKSLDKALTKGIFHKNFVSRHKSYLNKIVNEIK